MLPPCHPGRCRIQSTSASCASTARSASKTRGGQVGAPAGSRRAAPPRASCGTQCTAPQLLCAVPPCLPLLTAAAPAPPPNRPPLAQEIAEKAEVSAQRAKEAAAHRKEYLVERASAARDARALRNRGALGRWSLGGGWWLARGLAICRGHGSEPAAAPHTHQPAPARPCACPRRAARARAPGARAQQGKGRRPRHAPGGAQGGWLCDCGGWGAAGVGALRHGHARSSYRAGEGGPRITSCAPQHEHHLTTSPSFVPLPPPQAHDFEAYQDMLRTQAAAAPAGAGERYEQISKFLAGGWCF